MRKLAATLAACAAGLAIACGGGSGGDSKTSTPEPAATTAPPTAVPTPLVSGSHVNSIGVGYEADIPSGWHLRPNVITSSSFRGDAYFKDEQNPANPDQPQTNIAIGCQPKMPDTGTLDDQLALEVKGLQQLKRENIRTADHAPVSGLPAKQIDFVYRLTSTPPTPVPPTPAAAPVNIVLDQRQILVLSEGCVWKITLSTPVGAIDSEATVFETVEPGLRSSSIARS